MNTHPIQWSDWTNLIRLFPPTGTVDSHTQYELEARFRPFRTRGAEPRIHSSTYHRLLVQLKALQLPSTTSNSTVYSADVPNQLNQKARLIVENTTEGIVTTYQTKEQLAVHDYPDYGIRISLSREVERQPVPTLSQFPYTYSRNRLRHSFILIPDLIRLDLTTVTPIAVDQKSSEVRYEVELELLTIPDVSHTEILRQFADQVALMWSLLHDSELFYLPSERAIIERYLISQLGPDPRAALVESRNLKRRDLVVGGIVGNEQFDQSLLRLTGIGDPRALENGKPYRNGTRYLVTYKADGLRNLLVFHKISRTDGKGKSQNYFTVWLVHPPHSYNLVIALDESVIPAQLMNVITGHLYGSMLDGELIRSSKVSSKYYFLAFDGLAYRGANIQKHNYLFRMGADNVNAEQKGVGRTIAVIWQTVMRVLASHGVERLNVNSKTSLVINNVSEFFEHTRSLLEKTAELPYQEDGLMYIPVDVIYNPKSNTIPIEQRKLTDIPDTCKWKPPEKITIDFKIRWAIGGETLTLHSTEKIAQPNQPDRFVSVEFVGDALMPVGPQQIDATNPILYPNGTAVPSNTVVEFAWDRKLEKLVPYKIRFDKPGPNMIDVALDNWSAIQDPLTAEDISGTTLKLAFKNHSELKRRLFKSVKRQDNDLTVLDIGGGKGGDADKWKLLGGRVVTVEPDLAHRTVLQDRVRRIRIDDRVKVLATTGEDTVAITQATREWLGGPADIVSIMLSLSFFWEDSDHLEALVQTIVHNLKPGGKLIFFTIDGNSVTQLFEPALGGQVRSTIPLGNGIFTLSPPPTQGGKGRMLELDIPGTIMGKQLEYLVMLDDLTLRLSKYGISLEEFHRASAPIKRGKFKLVYPFLSTEQAIYNGLFSWGHYVHRGKMVDIPVVNIVRNEVRNDGVTNLNPNLGPSPFLPKVSTSPLPLPAIPTLPALTLPAGQITPSSTIVVPPPKVGLPTIAPLFTSIGNAPGSTLPLPILPLFPTLPTSVGGMIRIVPVVTGAELPATPLPMLPVTPPINPADRAWGDDVVVPVTCTWQDQLVRIATLGDGSCFIHALLKAISLDYQDHPSFGYRSNLVKRFRRDMGLLLNIPDQRYPGHVYWETANHGEFVNLFANQVLSDNLAVVDEIVDYGLSGLQRMFNSSYYLGNEVYGFVTELLNVNLCILQATTKDLINHSYDQHDPSWPTVIIIGNTAHYEVIGLQTSTGVQTVFPPDSQVVQKLSQRFSQEHRPAWQPGSTLFNMLINYPDDHLHPRNHDGSLDMETFIFPDRLALQFSPTDPFVNILNTVIIQLRNYGYTVFSPFDHTSQ